MDHKELFLNVMRDAGLPTTLEDFQNEWEKHVEACSHVELYKYTYEPQHIVMVVEAC